MEYPRSPKVPPKDFAHSKFAWENELLHKSKKKKRKPVPFKINDLIVISIYVCL